MTELQKATRVFLDNWFSTEPRVRGVSTGVYIENMRKALEAEQAQAVEPTKTSWKNLVLWYEAGANDWENLRSIVTKMLQTPSPPPAGEQAQAVEPTGLRDAVAAVCEGWTLPDGARKMLESALWTNPAPPAGEQAQAVEPVCSRCKGLGYYDEGHENDDGSMSGGNYVDCACNKKDFTQCTTVTNDCLGGCKSLSEHQNYTHPAPTTIRPASNGALPRVRMEGNHAGRTLLCVQHANRGAASSSAHPAIKEIVINADYREMWVEQVRINQELCAQLAAS